MSELIRRNGDCRIFLSEKENIAVKKAVVNLRKDIFCVCDGDAAIVSDDQIPCNIYVGTIGNHTRIDEMIESGKLNVAPIVDQQGGMRWEGHVLQMIDDCLYIAGVGRRGTIFGIYELSRRIGVSPWYFFADVPVKEKNMITLPDNFYFSDYPSVQYRGIFLNDEEELNAWAKSHTKDHTIGPEAYEHIFELLLRLKANYIWPAMHVNYFNGDLENGRLAEEMGIVVGTSHCDMLLRSNQNEWNPWVQKKGYTDVVYDYSIKGRNREKLQEYWKESVEQNKDYEVCYTIGMRGIHDTGFVTKEIDNLQNISEQEREQKKVELLQTVVTDQRKILCDVLGKEAGEHALQTFVPYKEVLPLYDHGLEVPDDVTIIWVDDNHGYVRRYPSEKERQRKGGHGLYYHGSYWAPAPMSYLFIDSIPLAHTGIELKKSYESGIRKIWVLNVGALKPLEQDIEFFIQTGWDVGKEEGISKDAYAFTRKWINDNFSGNYGEQVASIYNTFAQVTNVRKIEHMDTDIFSQTGYGNEAGKRLQRLQEAYDQANQIYKELPEREKDAFFELVLMKVQASYYTNCEYYCADRSRLSYARGNMQAADWYVTRSRKYLDYKRCMIQYYNKTMANGKWDHILTPERFAPPVTASYPAGKPALRIENPALSVHTWNEMEEDGVSLIEFERYGLHTKWIELGNMGCSSVAFSIQIPEETTWLKASATCGTVERECRVEFTVDPQAFDEGKAVTIMVLDETNQKKHDIVVRAKKEEKLSLTKEYVEADGYVSIPADGFCENHSPSKECQWERVPYIGRNEGAAMMAHNTALVSLEEQLPDTPYLEYHFYTYTAGTFLFELYRFLTLDSTGKIRVGVAVDNQPMQILSSEIVDEWIGDWEQCAMNDGEKLTLTLPELQEGTHTLRIYMVDNYVTFSKLVIYTKEKHASNIGPDWSVSENEQKKKELVEFPEVSQDGYQEMLKEMYHLSTGEYRLPNVIYAGKDFWNKDILYMKNEERFQEQLGNPRYQNVTDTDGRKDVFKAFGDGVICGKDGQIAIEAEYALEQSKYAYLTSDEQGNTWEHLQAETDGRTGFAMQIEKKNLYWSNPKEAPGMHYTICADRTGRYQVWMLVKFIDERTDACAIAIDGEVQPVSEQLSKGKMFTYSTTQIYFWSLISEVDLSQGEHVLSVYGVKSGLRIDRIYLTETGEYPAIDQEWKASERK